MAVHRRNQPSIQLRRQVGARDDWCCHYCGTRVAGPDESVWYEPRTFAGGPCGCGRGIRDEDTGDRTCNGCEHTQPYKGPPPGMSRAELDHVVPVSAGGQTTASNLVVACPGCNRAKAAQTYATFVDQSR